jgi:hypothetical protein
MSNPISLDNAAEEEEEIPCAPARRGVKKVVSILVKPKVNFVSLVGHAASGLSFGMVKDDEGTTQLIKNQPEPDSAMPKQTIPAFGAAGAVLNRVEFSIELFKTEEAVRQYLTESEIQFSRITKNDTHFIVPGVHADSLSDIEMVKGDKDGVALFIGKLKAPVAAKITPPVTEDAAKVVPIVKDDKAKPAHRVRGDEDDAPAVELSKSEAAPLEEIMVKFDGYAARQVKTQTVDDTMGIGTKDLPGLSDVFYAVRITVDNIVEQSAPGEVAAKIQAAFTRGGEIAVKLASVFVTLAKSDEGESTLDKEAIRKHFSSPEKSATAEVEGVVKKSEEAPAPGADMGALVEAALIKHLAPLSEQVSAVKGDMVEIKKSVDESLTGLESRLVEVEGVRQIRKSLPDDGETQIAKSDKEKAEEIRKAERTKREEEEAAADKAFQEKQRRSRLGLI